VYGLVLEQFKAGLQELNGLGPVKIKIQYTCLIVVVALHFSLICQSRKVTST